MRRCVGFLVARYGEFVLLRPQLSWHTVALWGLPPAALLIGVVALVVVVRAPPGPAGLGDRKFEPGRGSAPDGTAAR